MGRETENQTRLYKQGMVYLNAMVGTAKTLGKDHPLTKLMGSMAWGRSGFEMGPDAHTESYIRFAAGHEAMWGVYVSWCNIYDQEASDVLYKALITARSELR